MNGSRQLTDELVNAAIAAKAELPNVDVLLCPPTIFIGQAKDLAGESGEIETQVLIGSQNVSEYDCGAYTGETAASMLFELGCRYAIVGHSERRQIFGETSAQVADKFDAAQKGGLTPILCVGETIEQRESGETLAVITEQIQAVLDKLGVSTFHNAVVAYEPVWAIGTGLTATPEQAQEVHNEIRSMISNLDAAVADSLRILYGGSVKADNAAELFAQADIDGGLIGGASLKAGDFSIICQAAGLGQ